MWFSVTQYLKINYFKYMTTHRRFNIKLYSYFSAFFKQFSILDIARISKLFLAFPPTQALCCILTMIYLEHFNITGHTISCRTGKQTWYVLIHHKLKLHLILQENHQYGKFSYTLNFNCIWYYKKIILQIT